MPIFDTTYNCVFAPQNLKKSLYWYLSANLSGGYLLVLYLGALTGPREFCQILREEGAGGVPKVYNRTDPRDDIVLLRRTIWNVS